LLVSTGFDKGLKKNIHTRLFGFKKSVFLQPKIIEQKELKIKKLKGKKTYAYHSTISKEGKKETYRSEQVKGAGCMSAETRRLPESLHHHAEKAELRHA
jgi:hypothetical protein